MSLEAATPTGPPAAGPVDPPRPAGVPWLTEWPRSHPRPDGDWTVVGRGGWAALDPETARVRPVDPCDDPRLPGLAPALAGGAHLVGYRIGRRAVLRDGDRWIKVVRPGRAEALVDAHRRLAGALAASDVEVPAVVDHHADGRVVLSTVAGPSLHELLRRYEPEADLPLEAVAEALAVLHRVPPDPWPRRSPDDPARPVHLVARAEPGPAGRLRDVADVLPPLVGGTPAVVHGDLHDKNVLVGVRGGVTGIGLIDLDGVGLGVAEDDVANLAVHLELRALQAGFDPSVGRERARRLVRASRSVRSLDEERLHAAARHTWFRLACLYRHRMPGRDLTETLLARATA